MMCRICIFPMDLDGLREGLINWSIKRYETSTPISPSRADGCAQDLGMNCKVEIHGN